MTITINHLYGKLSIESDNLHVLNSFANDLRILAEQYNTSDELPVHEVYMGMFSKVYSRLESCGYYDTRKGGE